VPAEALELPAAAIFSEVEANPNIKTSNVNKPEMGERKSASLQVKEKVAVEF